MTRSLKDHENNSLHEFLNRSFKKFTQKDGSIDESGSSTDNSAKYMTRLFISKLMESGKAAELRASVLDLKAFISIHMIDENGKCIFCFSISWNLKNWARSKTGYLLFTIFIFSESVGNVRGHIRPTNKLLQPVDVVRRFMDQMGYGLYDGSVYRKPSETKYTYIHCSDVHSPHFWGLRDSRFYNFVRVADH